MNDDEPIHDSSLDRVLASGGSTVSQKPLIAIEKRLSGHQNYNIGPEVDKVNMNLELSKASDPNDQEGVFTMSFRSKGNKTANEEEIIQDQQAEAKNFINKLDQNQKKIFNKM